jgi:hypothetical protein
MLLPVKSVLEAGGRNLQLASRRSIKGCRIVKKIFVKRPITRRRLRDVKRSIDHLLNDLTNEFTRGQDLINACHGKRDILLNIGCGELIQEGWINIDYHP